MTTVGSVSVPLERTQACGEHQALGLANLTVGTDLGLYGAGLLALDTHAPGTALAQVENAGEHAEALRCPPEFHALRFDEGAEDQCAGRPQGAVQGELAGERTASSATLADMGVAPLGGGGGRSSG